MCSKLSDDLVAEIFNKVRVDEDRKAFTEVSKQWLEVARTCRTSLRVRKPRMPLCYLGRFPNLVDLRMKELNRTRKRKNRRSYYDPTKERIQRIARYCTKLETFMICSEAVPNAQDKGVLGTKGLKALAEGCDKLYTVMFKGMFVVGDAEVAVLSQYARNLKSLHLSDNFVITDDAFRAIGSTFINTLELRQCHKFTNKGLRFLVDGSTSQTLKKLIIDSCRRITDAGVQLLVRMRSLEHLELSGLGHQVTDVGGLAISTIQTLKELKLSYPRGMTDHTVAALAENCHNLEAFALCQSMTAPSIHEFTGSHECLKHLALFGLGLDIYEVERIVRECPLLEALVLDESEVDESIDKFWVTDKSEVDESSEADEPELPPENIITRVLRFGFPDVPLPHFMPTAWW